MKIPKGPIGKFKNNRPVHIYGAGISGLLMGLYLKRSGHKVSIFEIDKRVGGKIQTLSNEYGQIETAANAIYTSDEVMELIESLKLDYISASKGLKRKVWRNNFAKSPPFYLKEVLNIIFKLFKKVPKESHSMTVQDFFAPLTGDRFCSEVISSALGGIYAEEAKNLHFKSLFKTNLSNQSYFSFFRQYIKSKKGKTKSKSISFNGGMQSFINALEQELKENISTSHDHNLDLSVNNIICTDAHNASELLKDIQPKIANELKKIEYSFLSTSTFFTNKAVSFLNQSFGVLFPQFLKQKTIGILNNTAIFDNRTNTPEHFSYTLISKNKESTLDSIEAEFKDLTSLESDHILFSKTTPWPRAIPIYNQNRFDTIMSIRSQMVDLEDGLVIFGNYIDGISIREMVAMAKNFSLSNSTKFIEETSSGTHNKSTTPV